MSRQDVLGHDVLSSRLPNHARPLKIAAGVIAGKSLAQIGREEGVSRQTISKQLVSSDARQIVVALTFAALQELPSGDALKLPAPGTEFGSGCQYHHPRRRRAGSYRYCGQRFHPRRRRVAGEGKFIPGMDGERDSIVPRRHVGVCGGGSESIPC